MHIVVFTSKLKTLNDAEHASYDAASSRMIDLARQQPGYLGHFSKRDKALHGATVSYWDSLDAARTWGKNPEHRATQVLGRDSWYESFRLRHLDPTPESLCEEPYFFHLVPRTEWEAELGQDYVPLRFTHEGFIHGSLFAEDMTKICHRYYRDLPGDLLLLNIDRTKLKSPVRFDDPNRRFPHTYGPICRDAVTHIAELSKNKTGEWIIPPLT